MTPTEPCGLLLVDKPRGPTSHDVVAMVRRALGTRRVGHAGTLDPEATGLLLVLVGEATKLEPFLSGQEKGYRARVMLGRETDTLDAVGRITDERPLPAELVGELEAVASGAPLESTPMLARSIATELARIEQIPPNFSAIQVGGVRSHARARAGEAFELAARGVSVRSIECVGVELSAQPVVELELHVSKGYYVRALARDLGRGLGVPASLCGLRRTRSGVFHVDEAIPIVERPARHDLEPRLVALASAARRALATRELDSDEERIVRFGQRLPDTRPAEAGHTNGPVALMSRNDGALVAIAEPDLEGSLRVLRGFVASTPS
jgi:tRNA pseudouridine55 synthase